jgi:D-aspartate ligase
VNAANPRRAEPGWPSAVIAGAFQTGVLGVRSLRRRGVRAVMFDCYAAMPGFYSVYGPARLCPDPDVKPAEWVDFMQALARELSAAGGGKPVLIASSDRYVTAIYRNADVLREHFTLSPGVPLQGRFAEKESQYELAQRHGMPMPLTRFAATEDDVFEFGRHAMYPCLIKPNHFREWEKFPPGHPLLKQKVSICRSAAELMANYRLAAPATPKVILQEIIEGPDTAKRVYLSVYDKDSRRIANALFLEWRCDPFGFGPATVTVPVVDPEADTVCDAWLRSIGYAGICEIEVKRDTRDGKVKLIEANPRLSGGGDAAPHNGVDLCWLHYCELIGRHIEPVGPDGRYFKHIVLRAEGAAIPNYWRAGLLGWRDLLTTYEPRVAFFDLDWRDPRYSLETLYVTMRLLLRGIWRNLRGGRTGP